VVIGRRTISAAAAALALAAPAQASAARPKAPEQTQSGPLQVLNRRQRDVLRLLGAERLSQSGNHV